MRALPPARIAARVASNDSDASSAMCWIVAIVISAVSWMAASCVRLVSPRCVWWRALGAPAGLASGCKSRAPADKVPAHFVAVGRAPVGVYLAIALDAALVGCLQDVCADCFVGHVLASPLCVVGGVRRPQLVGPDGEELGHCIEARAQGRCCDGENESVHLCASPFR